MTKQNFDLIVGNKKGHYFGLRYSKYSTGDIVYIEFLKGTGLYLYKKDIKRILKFLSETYEVMQ